MICVRACGAAHIDVTGGILFWGCSFGGVYVPCVYSPSSVSHLPFRTSSPLHSFPAAPLFCRHPNVQNIILLNKVQLSVLFLLPGSSYPEPVPCFCPPFYVCRFLQILLENLSLLKNLLFSPIALIYDSVCVCVCACACACVVCVRVVHVEACAGLAL